MNHCLKLQVSYPRHFKTICAPAILQNIIAPPNYQVIKPQPPTQTIHLISNTLLQNTIKQLKRKAVFLLPERLAIEPAPERMVNEGPDELRAIMIPPLPQNLEVELFKNTLPYLDAEDMYIDDDINFFIQKYETDGLILKLNQPKNENTSRIKNISSGNEIKISKLINNTNIERQVG